MADMSITYSGIIREITSDVEEAIAWLAAGREPESRVVRQGTVEVRPINVEGRISGGNFSATVDDDPDQLNGYRFLVAGELTDPCAAARQRASEARRQLEIAIRDGASQNAIRLLEQTLNERKRELKNCVRGAGISGVGFRSPLRMFRSMDLFRTAVENVTIGNLRAFVRILTPDDVDALNRLFGTNLQTFFSNADLAQLVGNNTPPNITISSVRTQGGRVRIEFIAAGPLGQDVGGSMEVEVEPSLSHNFRTMVSMQLAEFDLEGVLGEFAETFIKEARGGAERAVSVTEAQLNATLANGLDRLFDLGGTATLLGVEEAANGIRVSIVVGFLLGSREDPCQAIRDEMRRRTQEIAAAVRDGVREDIINQLRTQLEAKRRELRSCRQRAAPAVEAATGVVSMLRVHELGTGFGPDDDHLDAEVIVQLSRRPGESFGFQLRDDPRLPAARGMLATLRAVLASRSPVTLEFVPTGPTVRRIIRVVSA